jgi:hypothetical protein
MTAAASSADVQSVWAPYFCLLLHLDCDAVDLAYDFVVNQKADHYPVLKFWGMQLVILATLG